MFRSHLVLRHKSDGSIGVLNVVQEANQEVQERVARKLASAWVTQFPGDRIEIRASTTAHHCRPVNNVVKELAH